MFEEFRKGSYREFREAWRINEGWLRSFEEQIPSDIDPKLRERIEDLISKSRQFFNDVDKWFRDNHYNTLPEPLRCPAFPGQLIVRN
ncbi:hypothetical protein [Gordonia crocea]|nr:hypothetical protein [Gordonia crocea]